jgi:hypothetical protein
MKPKGKFWPEVRKRIWQKAQELFQGDELRTMKHDAKGITAEKCELREAGYFYEAKLIVLRQVNLEKKGHSEFDELAGLYEKQQKEILKEEHKHRR